MASGKLRSLIRLFALLGLSLLCLGPLLFLISSSVKQGDLFKLESFSDIIPKSWTLSAYAEVFDKLPDFPLFFRSTAILCACGVFLELTLATLAAYPLARLNFRGKGLIMSALLATLMLPTQANIIVNFITIRGLGLYDTLSAVILPSAVSVFGIFLMRQAFLVIPKDLEDAARIDGASEWFIFWRVMVPLTRPALGTLALFSFVSHWNNFMWPLIVLQSRSLYPLSVGLAYMANAFDSNFRIVAAGSVISMLPIIAVFLVTQKQFIRGLTAGAVK